MKKSFILLLALGWLNVSGQTGPVFQYNHPPKETLRSLALEETAKGYAFRVYMVMILNSNLKDTTLNLTEANISFIFDNLHFEEVYLQEGGYYNSGYNPSTKKMVPSLGHKWNGFLWVFRVGTFSIPLIKEDCGNILNCKASRITIVQKKEVSKPTISEPEPVIVSIKINNIIDGDSSVIERRDTTIISSSPKKGSVVVVEINNKMNFKNPFLDSSIDKKIEVIKKKNWVQWVKKNWWWASSVVAIGTGFIAHDSNHYWYLWFPKPKGTMSDDRGDTTEKGTMSGDRNGNETTTSGSNGGRASAPPQLK